jgi:hypothetical protein
MRAEDLVFWLDALQPDTDQSSGVLCRRHADSMVLPRHWTLDDLREPVPRLFRPPVAAPATPTSSRRRRSTVVNDGEQLLLEAEPVVARPVSDTASDLVPDARSDVDGTRVRRGVTSGDAAGDETAGTFDAAVPWTPTFDESDDLGGLLSARSPLLARAFRGDDRPRQS